uniref:Uncharacterized protein n=1 Tax=Anguilla anguilla TaxID=7936 RepID=A0A0E9TTA5_ANGAN
MWKTAVMPLPYTAPVQENHRVLLAFCSLITFSSQ